MISFNLQIFRVLSKTDDDSCQIVMWTPALYDLLGSCLYLLPLQHVARHVSQSLRMQLPIYSYAIKWG
ncbi:hypothetical protein SLE2022_229800 [Rubroshorea leprosula]